MHHGDDQGDLNYGHGQGQQQSAKGFANLMRKNFGVMHRCQD
jgi:hypothetical protein